MCDFFKDIEITEDDIKENDNIENKPSFYFVVSFFPQNKDLLERKMEELLKEQYDVQEKDEIVYVSCNLRDADEVEWLIFLRKLLKPLHAESFAIITKSDGNFDICCYKTIELHDNLKGIKNSLHKMIDGFNYEPIDIKELLDQYKTIYRKGSLVIRNINSDVDINGYFGYTYNIIDKFFYQLNKDIDLPCPSDKIHRIMQYPNINPNIPILLKKEMPKYSDLWKNMENKDKDRYIPQGEVLGYYTREDEIFNVRDIEVSCEGPHIVISPENIIKATSDGSISFEVLFTKVLIHEIAHAMMDKYRIVINGEIFSMNIAEGQPKSLEAKAMEESLANMIALKCFELCDKQNFDVVKNSIKCQPTIYQFGIQQFNAGADWKAWRNCKKEVNPALRNWFTACFNDGEIREGLKYNCDTTGFHVSIDMKCF